MGLGRATCCLSNVLKFTLGKKYCNEHATNKKSVAENSELMEKHLLPRVMYSRNFFSPLHKKLATYLFYSVWANSWEKAVLEEMGFVPRDCVVRASGLESSTPAGLWPHSRTAGTPAAAKGMARPSPAAPRLTQHSLYLHSLLTGI